MVPPHNDVLIGGGSLLLCAVLVAGVKGNFLTRIPTALKTYNETFGGPPDLVMLHSNFW
jgi:hypothetical protein